MWGDFVNMLTQEIKELMRRDGIYANRIEIMPQDVTTFHAHEHVELVYIAQGQGVHRIGEECFSVKKGDIALVNYGVPHQVAAVQGKLVVYNFLFTPEYLDAAMKGTRDFCDMNHHFLLGNFYRRGFEQCIRVTADGAENACVRTLYERVLQEYREKQIGYREILRGYLIELLIMIFRLNLREHGGTTSDIPEVLEYIGAHFTQQISLEQLAAMAGCSVSSFCRKFRLLTGSTVSRYIQNLRIEYACSLLAQTDSNVTQIAEQVGYRDSKYFYEVFRRVTGKLPKDFR